MTAIDKTKLTPEALERLKIIMPEEYAAIQAARHVNVWLDKFVTDEKTYKNLAQLKEQVRILSEVDDPVLIVGETGTGKEILANALHGDRGENGGRFIALNCAGIPETLVESALFGHKGGSFTGATKEDRTGVFQSAWNGTVFLDEIGELSMQVQAKLLRALQEKAITKVGAEDKECIPINCRFVAATHRDIKSRIATGDFREDLYWRISTFTLETMPIRDRTADIPLIVKKLIMRDKGKCKHEIDDIKSFCQPIIEHVRGGGQFSGNVRQLEQLVRQYHVLGILPKFED